MMTTATWYFTHASVRHHQPDQAAINAHYKTTSTDLPARSRPVGRSVGQSVGLIFEIDLSASVYVSLSPTRRHSVTCQLVATFVAVVLGYTRKFPRLPAALASPAMCMLYNCLEWYK